MNEEYDVCLIAEGTYPYISGGVSSVIAQTIQNLPELKFAIFFIGSTANLAEKPLYPIPDNVKRIEPVFLFDGLPDAQKRQHTKPSKMRDAFYESLQRFLINENPERIDHAFTEVIDRFFAAESEMSFMNWCKDSKAWQVIVETCRTHLPETSFIDYFYTTRFLALPLWNLLNGIKRMPQAKVYHSLCTGYAGLTAVVATRLKGGQSIISEHGIYVKERISEISLAKWIHEAQSAYVTVDSDLGDLKRLWIHKFRYISEYSYRRCDGLTTLYQGNRQMQEEFGAPAGKSEIIPNGIDFAAFAPAYARRRQRLAQSQPNTIGFIGRIVRIKDVKTLLRAMASVHRVLPQAVLRLLGPTNEEPDYFEECQAMAQQLGIEQVVEFVGKKNLREALSEIDLMVLTSISEGQPLVMLEGFAAGIPCVATDVGSCRALIFGESPEDRALGSAGNLTKVSSPRQTANALINLLQSPETLQACGEAGRARAQRYYQQDAIMQRYRELYARHMPPPVPLTALKGAL
jgi:glycosyltransferase involved in cell wall biosynthesis